MSLRNAYKQKLAAQVEEQRAKLGVMKARAKRIAADGKIIGYEELANAEQSLGHLASKMKRIAGASATALAEVRGGVGRALDDLQVSTKRAAARFSETKAKPGASPRRPGGRQGTPPKATK